MTEEETISLVSDSCSYGCVPYFDLPNMLHVQMFKLTMCDYLKNVLGGCELAKGALDRYGELLMFALTGRTTCMCKQYILL